MESPKLVASITKAILEVIIARTLVSEDGSAKEQTSDTHTEQEKHIDQLVALLKPFLEDDKSRLEVLIATEEFCASKKFPDGLIESLFRLYYNKDIIEDAVHFAYKDLQRSGQTRKEAIKRLNGWFGYLSSGGDVDDSR